MPPRMKEHARVLATDDGPMCQVSCLIAIVFPLTSAFLCQVLVNLLPFPRYQSHPNSYLQLGLVTCISSTHATANGVWFPGEGVLYLRALFWVLEGSFPFSFPETSLKRENLHVRAPSGAPDHVVAAGRCRGAAEVGQAGGRPSNDALVGGALWGLAVVLW